MRKFMVLLLLLSVCHIKADAQYMTARSIIKIKDTTRQEEKAKAKAEEEARIAAQKEAETKAKAEEQARIVAQKEAEAKSKAEEQARIVAEREAKTRQYTRASKGYDQYINLSYGYNRVSDFIELNYIGGYRFNHLFFLGIGTGVDFALFTPIMEEKFANCMPTRVNIPVYFNFRTNFLNKAWSPYISVSAGARISPISQKRNGYTYNQSGFLGDISFGIERRLGQRSSLYLGVGYRIESFLSIIKPVQYHNTSYNYNNSIVHGFNAHIGVSF